MPLALFLYWSTRLMLSDLHCHHHSCLSYLKMNDTAISILASYWQFSVYIEFRQTLAQLVGLI